MARMLLFKNITEGGSPVKEPQKKTNLLSREGEKQDYIVMICKSDAEIKQVSELLLQVNRATLIAYYRLEDLVLNRPNGEVALFILADGDELETLNKMLEWLRYRWPRSRLAVVGNQGGGEVEITARKGGAYFLTRPVSRWEWEALLDHLL